MYMINMCEYVYTHMYIYLDHVYNKQASVVFWILPMYELL